MIDYRKAAAVPVWTLATGAVSVSFDHRGGAPDSRRPASAPGVTAAGTLSPRYRPCHRAGQAAFLSDVRCAKTTTFAE